MKRTIELSDIDAHSRSSLIAVGQSSLEAIRPAVTQNKVLLWSVGLLGLVSVAGLSLNGQSSVALPVAAIGLAACSYFFVQHKNASSEYRSAFDTWRSKVLNLIKDGTSLSSGATLGTDDFDRSGLNLLAYNCYSGGNHLSVGPIQACNLQVANERVETYTESVYRTDSEGRSFTESVTRTRTVVDPVYHGLFLRAEITMPHPGWVVLNPRKMGAPRSLQKVEVVSPRLSSLYTIAADVPFLGHRILSPSMQVEISRYTHEHQSIPRLSYRNNLLYVAIPNEYVRLGEIPPIHKPVSAKHLAEVITSCHETIRFLAETWDRLCPDD